MKIITISREFGSGGRELGKRLADAMGITCYDQQIIEMIAEKEQLDKTYVANKSERSISAFYPTTIARGFYRPNYAMIQSAQIMASEHELIKKIASEGNCIIVGRAADVILADMQPFSIFVCADDETKLQRCRARADSDEKLTDKELLRKCCEIDKRRAAYRKMFTGKKWGEASGYHLCVNTSGKEIKQLVPGILEYIQNWISEE
ncbi:MAG: cytidylate kinase-like family protein [Clostridia bacterium]|nr:cytidylate kinase-like family protein [Clostridia bacterium]